MEKDLIVIAIGGADAEAANLVDAAHLEDEGEERRTDGVHIVFKNGVLLSLDRAGLQDVAIRIHNAENAVRATDVHSYYIRFYIFPSAKIKKK